MSLLAARFAINLSYAVLTYAGLATTGLLLAAGFIFLRRSLGSDDSGVRHRYGVGGTLLLAMGMVMCLIAL